ncbi:hypothetical protein D3C81_783540 [compost metagenome]
MILKLPFACCSAYLLAIKLLVILIAFALNAPAKPLLEETTTINTLFGSRSTVKGELLPSTLAETSAKISLSLFAYGRNCKIALVARFNLAAETIFIAFVICCVDDTEVIRFLTSFKFAIFVLSIKYLVLSIEPCQ